jgi:wyosine [tRNA(Phe)-imidazoG37] synthetase (radical SAM superfamily)
MKFDQFIQYRALSMKSSVEGLGSAKIVDSMIEKDAGMAAHFKTVCAPISLQLFDRMTETLAMLDISKRTFIEAAIIAALDQADVIMKEVDIFENQNPFEKTPA